MMGKLDAIINRTIGRVFHIKIDTQDNPDRRLAGTLKVGTERQTITRRIGRKFNLSPDIVPYHNRSPQGTLKTIVTLFISV